MSDKKEASKITLRTAEQCIANAQALLERGTK